MALAFLDNVSYKGKKPNFERDQFDTIANMAAFSDNYLPDTFIATCVETGKAYLYNKTNTIDPTLGKWRELGGSSATTPAPTPVKGKDFYYGTSATDTGIVLSSLTKATLSLADTEVSITSAAEYIVFAVPQAGGNISIFDENGMNNTSSFIKSTISDGTDNFDLYISDSQIYCVDFKYVIKY